MPLPNLLPATLIALIADFILSSSSRAAEVEHLRIDIDGPLPPAKAEEVYHQIKGDMADGYTPAKDPVIEAYPAWQRFNIAPYLSDTHGNRYANNFNNEKAATAG